MAAQITIDQPTGAGAGTPGETRNDIWLGQQVQLTSSGTGSTYQWELLDQPPGSTVILGTPTAVTSTFTPLVVGSYRIRLTVDGGGSGNVTTRIVRVRYTSTGILTKRGWSPPAVEENDDEDNASGNTRGWAPQIEVIVDDANAALTTLVFRPGGGVDAGHVFADWETLMATFAGITGPVVIEIDDSVTSPAVIPAGIWDLENRAILRGRGVVAAPTLQFANTGYLRDPLGFQYIRSTLTGTDAGGVDMTAGTALFVEDATFQNVSTGGPILTFDNVTATLRGASSLATVTAQPAILVAPGATATIFAEDGASIGSDAMAGTPTGVTVNLIGVSSSCSSTQTGLGGPLTINAPLVPEPYTFIYRPGYSGTPQPNLYTDWATLMTDLGNVEGPKVIQFDDTDAACQIPVGTWDFGYNTTLAGTRVGNPATGVPVSVRGVLQDVYALDRGIVLTSLSGAAIFTWSTFGTTVPQTLFMDRDAIIDTTGAAAPLVDMSGTDHLIVEMRGSAAIKSVGVAAFNVTHANADLRIRMYDHSFVADNVVTATAGVAQALLMSNIARLRQNPSGNFTVERTASRRRIHTLSKSNLTESTGTPVIVGAVYVDPEELPSYGYLTDQRPTAKFRVVLETTAPGQAAVMDLFDTNGVFNSGTPAPITGSQQDTTTGTAPPRPGGGTPLTPNPLVASAYEVDLSTVFFGGAWTNPGVYEARLWIAVPGGGNVATCKSAELIIEW